MAPTQPKNSFGFSVKDQDPTDSAKRVMAFAKKLLEVSKQVNLQFE